MGDSFYVTTPIYYVNDRPHIGHAYTTILADVLARYHRMQGHPTWFLTGVDEHGQKVQQAAVKRGVPPQQHVDEMVVHFQDLAQRINASNDDFIRTTESRHTAVVQDLLQSLYDRGEIYRKTYGGWYCEADEMFVQEKDLVDGKSPSGRPVEWVEESNYFFKMGAYQEWLIDYIEQHPRFILPAYRANETLGFLRKQKLEDLCISRPKTRLAWGIPLPFDTEYVTYVWFDALTNYISAVGYGTDEAKFDQWWPAVHLIGKDILTTHTVYWPTMLHAAGIPLPKTVFAHGWWLNEDGTKGSKTGGAVNPEPIMEAYGVDAFRYHLIADMVLGQDSGFGIRQFNDRYNADLVNNLGNGVRRVLELLRKNFDGVVPAIDASALGTAESALRESAEAAQTAWRGHFDGMQLHQAMSEALRLSSAINTYVDLRKPWQQAKDGDTAELAITLVTAIEALRVVSALLYPVLPDRMGELRRCLGCPDTPTLADAWGTVTAGIELESVALFPRKKLQDAPGFAASKPAAAPASTPAPEGVVAVDQIRFDEFKKVKLRTAKVIHADRIEGADKLLRLEVMVGDERRQIVAGIAEYYEPDSLRHKIVVIVANLEPAMIRGIESQGMLLAASKGTNLKLVTVDGEMASGANVS